MNSNDAIKLSLLAGEILLSSGAETYRVEDTMRRLLINCGYIESEAFVVSTGVFASITGTGEGKSRTAVKRISKRTYDIERIIKVNDISRNFAEGKILIEGAISALEEVKSGAKIVNYPFVKIFASGMTCGCFTFMFGGSLPDCVNAFFTGIILQILTQQLNKIKVADALVNIIGGAVISFLALTFLNFGVGETLDYIIIGSLMLLVPGVTIVNAIRDVLEGDYLSGSSRIMDALIIALSIACGVGVALKIWFQIFGGVII